MSKERDPRTRTGLRFPEEPDVFDRLLADQGNVTTDDWRGNIAEEIDVPKPSHDIRLNLRLGRRLGFLATQCGAKHDMSREGWIRKVMAEAIERELGVPAADLMAEVRASHPPRPRSVKDRLQSDDR